jgi:hypothetical protein
MFCSAQQNISLPALGDPSLRLRMTLGRGLRRGTRSFAAAQDDKSKTQGDTEGAILMVNALSEITDMPARADTSAMGAIMHFQKIRRMIKSASQVSP